MKKFLQAFLTLLCVVTCAFGFTACGEESENETSKKPEVPQIRDDIFAPNLVSLGDYLYWEPYERATAYTIYQGNTELATVTQNYYHIGELEEDTFFTATATYSDITSEHSRPVRVSKNTGFTGDEILAFSPIESLGTQNVPSTVRKIVITSDTAAIVEGSFILEPRNTDITFALTNITLTSTAATGVIHTADGSYDRTTNDWSIIFQVEGVCAVEGAELPAPSAPKANSGDDGEDGTNGVNAVLASSVVVTGNGNLSFIGGKGQNGARGADSDFLSYSTYGHGGNGGDGGSALICKYLLLNMNNNGTLTLANGAGGAAGGRGKDNNPVSESLPHFSHSAAECDGVEGSAGQSSVQFSLTLGGTLNK